MGKNGHGQTPGDRLCRGVLSLVEDSQIRYRFSTPTSSHAVRPMRVSGRVALTEVRQGTEISCSTLFQQPCEPPLFGDFSASAISLARLLAGAPCSDLRFWIMARMSGPSVYLQLVILRQDLEQTASMSDMSRSRHDRSKSSARVLAPGCEIWGVYSPLPTLGILEVPAS